RSKCKGEAAVQNLLDDFIIVRTGGLYGKRGVNFVNTIVKMAQEKDELRVVNDQWMSPTSTIDLSRAIGTLHEVSAQGIFHLVNSGFCTWYQFACKIIAITGSTCKVIPISSDELDRPAPRPAFAVLDCSKYTNVTGMELRPWEKALTDYLSTL
ncbi:MAG: sugar nucleotide-binding protein, partial [Thermodesulfobacteriota bacterium]|nr:sugar nucleotide-binding protein [Thermodesulfobacteriota bacterium]